MLLSFRVVRDNGRTPYDHIKVRSFLVEGAHYVVIGYQGCKVVTICRQKELLKCNVRAITFR